MNSVKENNQSFKIRLLDKLISLLFKSQFFKDKSKIIAERLIYSSQGYKFSYDSKENGELEFLQFLSKRNGNDCFKFFDIGAHHGTYTSMIISLFSKYQGQLFEPTPESFEKLNMTFQNNDKLILNNTAISNFSGDADFIRYPDDPTRNGLSGVGKEILLGSENIRCKVVRGDEFCQNIGIDKFCLLKIDAEGHDFNVVSGFESLLRNKSIEVVQFEYTFKHAELGIPLKKYYDFFKALGYEIGPLRKYGVDFYEDFDPIYNMYEFGPNYVAVRSELVNEFRCFNL